MTGFRTTSLKSLTTQMLVVGAVDVRRPRASARLAAAVALALGLWGAPGLAQDDSSDPAEPADDKGPADKRPSDNKGPADDKGPTDGKGPKLSGEAQDGPSPDEALALYQGLVKEKPQNPEYHQLLAVAYAELGRLDAARREANAAIQLTPDGSEMWQALGLIEERAKNYKAAIAAYRTAIEIHRNVEYRLDLARTLGLAGMPAEEQAEYTAIATEHAADVDVMHGLGQHFTEEGQYELAHTYFDKAIGLAKLNQTAAGLKVEVDILTNKAKAYGDQGRNVEALGALTRARELDENDADVHYNIGILYYRLKRFDAAQASFEVAVLKQKEFARAYNNLGVVHDRLKQHEAALLAFGRAIEAEAEYAEAHFNRGLSAFKLKRWRQAEQSFLRALEFDSDLADAKFYLGETYYQLKEPSKALAVYKEALRMNPGDADTHRRLGDIHLEKGDLDLAIGEYWAAVDADDRVQANIQQLMLTLMTRAAEGDVRRAAKLGADGLEKDPHAVETRAVLASIYTRMGRPLSAQQVLESGVKLAPNSAKMHAAYGTFLLEEGKYREAELEFQQAQRLDAQSHDALYGLGRVQLAQGKKKDAISLMKKALEIRPGYSEARAQLGCILMYQKKYDSALKELKRATEDDPRSGLAWFCRGYATFNNQKRPRGLSRDEIIAFRAKQKSDAESYFRKAVAVEPDRAEAWYFLGEIQKMREDLVSAKASYKRAAQLNYDKALLEYEKLQAVP